MIHLNKSDIDLCLIRGEDTPTSLMDLPAGQQQRLTQRVRCASASQRVKCVSTCQVGREGIRFRRNLTSTNFSEFIHNLSKNKFSLKIPLRVRITKNAEWSTGPLTRPFTCSALLTSLACSAALTLLTTSFVGQ